MPVSRFNPPYSILVGSRGYAELRLPYQPIMDLKNWKVVAAEALMRWENQKLGHIPPDRFIPLAEETGLIHDIGDWAIYRACEDMTAWSAVRPVRVAINISSRRNRSVPPDFFPSP